MNQKNNEIQEQLPEAYRLITYGAQCVYLVREMFLQEGRLSFKDVFTELVRKGGEGMRSYAPSAYLSMLAEADNQYVSRMDDVSAVRAFDTDMFVEPVNVTAQPSPEEEARSKRLKAQMDEYGERTVVKGLLCREAEDLHYIGLQLGPEMLQDGLLNFHSFFSEMVRVMGDRVRPLVKHIYMALQADVDDQSLTHMDTLEQVRDFDPLTNISKLGSAKTRQRKLKFQELEEECQKYRKLKDTGRSRFTPSQLDNMIILGLILVGAGFGYDLFYRLYFLNIIDISTIFIILFIPIILALLARFLLGVKINERMGAFVFMISCLLPWLFVSTNMWFASGPIQQEAYNVYHVSEDTDDKTYSVHISLDDDHNKRFDFTPRDGYKRNEVFATDIVQLQTQRGLWGIKVIKDLKLIDLQSEPEAEQQ